jgi:hypothetical protein
MVVRRYVDFVGTFGSYTAQCSGIRSSAESRRSLLCKSPAVVVVILRVTAYYVNRYETLRGDVTGSTRRKFISAIVLSFFLHSVLFLFLSNLNCLKSILFVFIIYSLADDAHAPLSGFGKINLRPTASQLPFAILDLVSNLRAPK